MKYVILIHFNGYYESGYYCSLYTYQGEYHTVCETNKNHKNVKKYKTLIGVARGVESLTRKLGLGRNELQIVPLEDV